ncbi:oxidoreductase [Metapseudomonas resinovorans]|uniref:Putative oxidoreductase n=1 Tax=Metapseudomonas resinovorans NBRC 106553 TaxID=1245471 RepID=S6BH48_METRE|nr:oxidoreductase [Pseudomonas resinovorans]BAN48464.1 putative oxidoreductase [Pseudomonas resinovorans NBRC 106553]
MPYSRLFEPVRLGSLELANRVLVGPMCQYSADDGCMSDWHLIHLGHLALSGAGLLAIETTAVLPEGRMTHADVGLWNDRTQAAIALTLESIRRWSDIPIAIELSHAGRKGSVQVPWKGGAQLTSRHALGWQTKAPSALPYRFGQNAPEALDRADLQRIREGFARAARRASRAGIDVVQIHAAHGYLLHQFLSPLSNHRSDAYGSSLDGRMRFPLEVFEQVRSAFPANLPVTVRLCAADGIDGGWTLDQALSFAKELERRGCAAIQVSSGELLPSQVVPVVLGEPAWLAREIRRAVAIPVVMTSQTGDYRQVEALVAGGNVDLVALTGTLLREPRWPWQAARSLGARVQVPLQYLALADTLAPVSGLD